MDNQNLSKIEALDRQLFEVLGSGSRLADDVWSLITRPAYLFSSARKLESGEDLIEELETAASKSGLTSLAGRLRDKISKGESLEEIDIEDTLLAVDQFWLYHLGEADAPKHKSAGMVGLIAFDRQSLSRLNALLDDNSEMSGIQSWRRKFCITRLRLVFNVAEGSFDIYQRHKRHAQLSRLKSLLEGDELRKTLDEVVKMLESPDLPIQFGIVRAVYFSCRYLINQLRTIDLERV